MVPSELASSALPEVTKVSAGQLEVPPQRTDEGSPAPVGATPISGLDQVVRRAAGGGMSGMRGTQLQQHLRGPRKGQAVPDQGPPVASRPRPRPKSKSRYSSIT